MTVRAPRERVCIEAVPGSNKYVVKQEQNLADHVLVVGERYQPCDFKSQTSLHLGRFTSGLMSNVNM